MKQLLIDTSTPTLSVAIVDGELLLAYEVIQGQKNHATTIMQVINDLMEVAKLQPNDLEQIAVAVGPGSYTGVRIGVTMAKTLAYTLAIPLKCVSSLSLLAMNYSEFDSIVVPLMNARRNAVYAGIYQFKAGKIATLLADSYLNINDLVIEIQKLNQEVIIVGDGKLFEEALAPTQSIYANHFNNLPNAYYLQAAPGEIYEGEEIHQVVPNYLKAVEAEEKWQAAHPNTEVYDYIITTKE